MVTAYTTAQQFLHETEHLLQERELENNLVLGICKGLPDKTIDNAAHTFVNVFDAGELKATSIKTLTRAIVSATSTDAKYLKELADHYLQNNISLKGAVGESSCTAIFSDHYTKQHVVEMELMLHQLASVNNLTTAPGRFEVAGHNDVDLITDWTLQFDRDANVSQVQGREQALRTTQARITAGNIFKWTDNGKTVSIAAINRKTKNIGIVGLVYTPEEHRGKGYAISNVKKLSEHILQSGFKYCALFTDKANPTSNHIYQKIGYVPLIDFVDIGFQ